MLRSPLPGRWRGSLAAVQGLVVLLIGLSRVYLAVHHPWDVLAGYAAGAPLLWVAVSLRRAAGKD